MAGVKTYICTRCGTHHKTDRRLCQTCTLEERFKGTELRKAVVDLLTYYSADDVLGEICEVLDDTRIPLTQTDADLRVWLSARIDLLLRK